MESRGATASLDLRETIAVETSAAPTALNLAALQRADLVLAASGEATRTFAATATTTLTEGDDTTQAVVPEPVVTRPLQVGLAALSATAAWTVGRAGGLLASLLASAPAWRSVDLLPVLRQQSETDPRSGSPTDPDGDANDDTGDDTPDGPSAPPPQDLSPSPRPTAAARAVILDIDP